MIIFGGSDQTGAAFNTVNTFNLTLEVWRLAVPVSAGSGGSVPSARKGHTAVCLNNTMIVYGKFSRCLLVVVFRVVGVFFYVWLFLPLILGDTTEIEYVLCPPNSRHATQGISKINHPQFAQKQTLTHRQSDSGLVSNLANIDYLLFHV